ncbi:MULTISPECIES: hypothetical protein [unclassified Paraburkholderia]|uniref:hypothetical protein n=1 Tax=unclassified Paraburkholderia TaxID=2615204 RepID=UPI0019808760|nr:MULTISPECIES: hypothetical protein [unclassified Paraburkholderia]MBN3853775.1 hypothetical protein [Paraburkholderia sp. Ac-20340]
MLSHHELAALLLIRDANAPLQTLDADFMALARYQLVEMDEDESGYAPRLTRRGQELLQRLTHDGPVQGSA